MVISYHNFAYVCGVECIHVLFRINGQDNLILIDVLGKRKLNQDTVDLIRCVLSGLHVIERAWQLAADSWRTHVRISLASAAPGRCLWIGGGVPGSNCGGGGG